MEYNIDGRKVYVSSPILFDRLSQEESIDKGSHLIHQKRLRAFCNNYGILVDKRNEYFFDAIQGDMVQYTVKFNEVLLKIRTGECDSIIAIHPDRLSRDAYLSLSILRIIEETKVALIFIDFPQLNVLDPLGRRVYIDMAIRAENEKLDAVRRSIAASKEYMQEGFSVGGQPPYGFKKEEVKIYGRKNPAVKWAVNETDVENVRYIFDLFLNLKRIRTVVRALNKSTLKPPKGERWSTSTIRRLLTNPIYKGEWIRNTHTQVKRPEKLMEGKYGVYWEKTAPKDWVTVKRDDAIISTEKWEMVQDIINSINYRKTNKKMVFLFAGMICGVCGNKMFGHRHGKDKKTGKRKGLSKYRCKNDLEPHCSHSVEVNAFDETIIEGIKSLAENTLFLHTLEENCRNQLMEKAELEQKIVELEKELDRADKIIEAYTEHIVDGTLKPSSAKAKIKKAEEQKELLEKKILDNDDAVRKIVTYSDYAEFIANDVKTILKGLYKYGRETQRDILKLLVNKITIHSDKVVCQLNYIPQLTSQIGKEAEMKSAISQTHDGDSSFLGKVYNRVQTHRG